MDILLDKQRLIEIRNSRGISQEDLGNCLGGSRRTVQGFEGGDGKMIIGHKLANKIAEIGLTCNSKEELLKASLGEMSVEEKLIEQTGVIGEKIQINDFARIDANYVGTYIHAGNKISSLVGFSEKADNIEVAGKDVAMQIAAMNPIALDENSVDAMVIEKEIEIAKDQLRAEGKPEEMLDKIAQGKLKRFFKDNTLVHQAFIKDSKVSVSQYLSSYNNDLTITSFNRVSIG